MTPPTDTSRTTVARPGAKRQTVPPAARAKSTATKGAKAAGRAAKAVGTAARTKRRVVKSPSPPPPVRKERRAARQSPIGRTVRRGRQAWREGGRLRPAGYYALLATIVVLNLVGLVMVLSA